MARIEGLDMAVATAAQKAAVDEELRLRGKMTNLKRIQAHSPDALRIYGEWFTLWARLAGKISERALLLLCLAISREQEATIPIGYFRRALAASGFDPDLSQPEPIEQAMQALGQAIGRNRGRAGDDVWNAATRGLDADDRANLAAFCGIMVATTTFANLVEASPDAEILPFLQPFEADLTQP